MAKAKPQSQDRTYPTTEVLKRMTEKQYAAHWKRICNEIREADPDGMDFMQRSGMLNDDNED